MKPKKDPLLLIALLLLVAYIAVLKVVGLSTFDFANLLESIKPVLAHSLLLFAAFILTLLGYLKGGSSRSIAAVLLCVASALTYLPLSALMFLPAALIAFAWWKETRS